MQNYLQVEEAIAKDLEVKVEPEYNMSEADVEKMLVSGTLDELLDALDFAPEGVKDIIKTKAVSLPLQDMAKREAIQKATGFNVSAAIAFSAVDSEEEEAAEAPAKPTRRVQPTTSKYQVIE